jgi:hypothetical protein
MRLIGKNSMAGSRPAFAMLTGAMLAAFATQPATAQPPADLQGYSVAIAGAARDGVEGATRAMAPEK